jgi:hypothetical protein
MGELPKAYYDDGVAIGAREPALSTEVLGGCSQCGLCCLSKGRRYQCEHLEVVTEVGVLQGTRCRVYEERWQGMPIKMMDRESGRGAYMTVCDITEQIPLEKLKRDMPAECALVWLVGG